MQIEGLKQIYLRPAPRLPKLIALSMVLWEMRKRNLPEPEICLVPESEQPKGEGIYNLDCCGNGYRQRGFVGEVDTVLEDFPEIEVQPELDCLADLVEAHNVRITRVKTESGGGTQRSTRNLLNRYHGSVGFLTGCGWDLIDEVGASKWKELVYGPAGELNLTGDHEPVTAGPAARRLTQGDFLQMSLHVIYTYVQAQARIRECGDTVFMTEGRGDAVVRSLLTLDFQGKGIGSGSFEPLTLSAYIRDLWNLGRTPREISNLLSPWVSVWFQAEQCLEEAPRLNPTYRFRFGQVQKADGVVFDFRVKPGQPAAPGSDNPLVHQAWLGDTASGHPRAQCVIVRRPSGQVGIFCRSVDWKSVGKVASGLQDLETQRWFYESGGVIFGGGTKSRCDVPPPVLPLYGDRNTVAGQAERHLVPVPTGRFPAGKYAPRDAVRSR